MSPAGESPRAQQLRDIVRDTGFVPEIDANGAVRFKAEGKIYLIPDDKDQAFIRIIHQQFRKVQNEEERPRLEAAAFDVNSSTKAAKVYVQPDQVWAVTELLCWPVDRFAAVLLKSLQVVDYASEQYLKALKRESGEQR
jgi:hypothetical protein